MRPHVLVNMAVTADGKVDTVERRGARISGAADTARVDRLRAAADAVMVGGHTLLGEDPRLTVRDVALIEARLAKGRPAQPIKVGVASRLGRPGSEAPSLLSGGHFLSDGGGRVIVATTRDTDAATLDWLEANGAQVIVHEPPRVDLARLLQELCGLCVARLMVEGGGTLVAALLEAGLVDELQLAIAPLLFGGQEAPTPVAGTGWPASQAISLRLLGTEVDEDGDVIVRYRVGGEPLP
jgi:2,5-diamino-6-(ribosylamino)-4(3H)-pyrimidinone 5'-phosphate reductase